MEICFYIDETRYHGTAVPFEQPNSAETRFAVRLEDRELPVFHVYMAGNGEWVSNDMQSADLVNAVGAEIEKRDGEETLSAIEPGRYTSSPVPETNAAKNTEITENGEIINEADDVDEHSFDKR